MNDRHCPICLAGSVRLRHADFPGYVEGTAYDILACRECDTQFVEAGTIGPELYDQLYRNHDAYGYERYHAYAHAVKQQRDPLGYLAAMEGTYSPVHAFLQGQRGLAILEVGSGYGYLTHSLNAAGHHAIGIELSPQAVAFARQQFGERFWQGDLVDYVSEEKVDLIIATELIEHLADPAGFVARCFTLLKEDGVLLVTTPNKGYNPGGLWQTDLPPVHTVWLSRSSCAALAARYGLRVDFLTGGYDAVSENRLAIFLLTRRNVLPRHRLTADGRAPHGWSARLAGWVNRLVKRVALFGPVRKASNRLAAWLSREPRVLCAVFAKGPVR